MITFLQRKTRQMLHNSRRCYFLLNFSLSLFERRFTLTFSLSIQTSFRRKVDESWCNLKCFGRGKKGMKVLEEMLLLDGWKVYEKDQEIVYNACFQFHLVEQSRFLFLSPLSPSLYFLLHPSFLTLFKISCLTLPLSLSLKDSSSVLNHPSWTSPTHHHHHLSIHSRSRSWSKDFKNFSRKWERDGGKWEKSQLRVHFLPVWESYQGGHAFKGRNRVLYQRMNLKERNSMLESSQVLSFCIFFSKLTFFHIFSTFRLRKNLSINSFPVGWRANRRLHRVHMVVWNETFSSHDTLILLVNWEWEWLK